MNVTKREAVKPEVATTTAVTAMATPSAKSATTCRRCGDESKLDQFGLCTKCNATVDEEYKLLYTDGTMEN